MTTRLLADNWTFQNAGEFICDGLDGDTADQLEIPHHEDGYSYKEVSSDFLRFDALCQVLSHLVFSDEVWVDEDSLETWEDYEPLLKAKAAQVVVPKAFKEFTAEWIPAREAIADQLCVNPAMLMKHQENKQQWEKDRTNADRMLAQLIWGGAGMLARADHFNLPYAPHPLREKMVARARFMQKRQATDALNKFVETERLRIYQEIGEVGIAGTIHLPPVVVEIIQESNDLSDLVATALQLRDSYKSLREWLGELQRDLSSENTRELMAHKKHLQGISRHLESLSAVAPAGDTTVQFGFGFVRAGFKVGSPFNDLKNRFGMRAEINRLVLAPAGMNAIDKLLVMLGEKSSEYGRKLKEQLSRRSDAQNH